MPHTDPGSPPQIRTNCKTHEHTNTADTDCVSTVIPATDPISGLVPGVLLFDAKAIIPDGSHVGLKCVPSRWNKKCKGITPIAPNKSDSPNCFMDAIAAFATNAIAAAKTVTCTTKTLGFYRAKWEYDKNTARIDLVIYELNGKLEYQVSGS